MDYRTQPSNPAPRRLRIGIVTETYPPEINGVALTLARWVEGLRQRGHGVQLVRVRQGGGDAPEPADSCETLCLPGFRIPGYPQLQGGWPAYGALLAHWRRVRPDLVHIVTEGPLGYAALRAARRLAIPVSTSFHTHFHNYSRHYHLGWLAAPIMAYLRHFHNQGVQTLVPTGELAERAPVPRFSPDPGAGAGGGYHACSRPGAAIGPCDSNGGGSGCSGGPARGPAGGGEESGTRHHRL
ncbi:MAG: glycosyltransferase [Candidatus Moduliflexus flocculans]|nr:glycosyltransferase [Candidatus Moduliflexus flocculans]